MSRSRWGKPYGYAPYQTDTGEHVWMWRKGQRVRFYTLDGVQVGPEQSNVAPAIAYAMHYRWNLNPDEPVPAA